MKKILFLFIFISFLAILVYPANATQFNVTNSAEVQSANPTTNYGSGSWLSATLSGTYVSFLDTGPASGNKILYIYTYDTNPDNNISIYETSYFNENTLTYLNKPGMGIKCVSNATFIGTSYHTINISSCSSQYLMFVGTTSTGFQARSDDATDPPYLIYTEIPPTSTSISFNAENYSIDSTATISFYVFNPDFVNHQYQWQLHNPSDTYYIYGYVPNSGTGSYQKSLNEPGIWFAELWECNVQGSICDQVILAADVANVSGSINPGGSGYINFSKPAYALGEQMAINWSIMNVDWWNYTYSIELYGTFGQLVNINQLTTSSGSWQPIHDQTTSGGYSAWLRSQKIGSVAKDTLDVATTQYGAGTSGVTGNITVPGTSYSRLNNVPILYNISANGRIFISSISSSASYYVSAGTAKSMTWTIPGNAPIGTYTAFLQYFDGLAWVTLGSDSFSVSAPSGVDFIEFDKSTYWAGDTMSINAYGLTSGFVRLIDSGGIIRLNQSIPATTATLYSYYIQTTDPSGTWNVSLYNNVGVIVASDLADVYFAGPQPTPTIPPTGVIPVGTIDYVGNLSAKKGAENDILNTLYGVIGGLLALAVMATMMFFLKQMKW